MALERYLREQRQETMLDRMRRAMSRAQGRWQPGESERGECVAGLTLNKAELVERIGKLPAATVDAVGDGLQLLFERV